MELRLTKRQSEIFIYLLERCPVRDAANFIEFTFPDSQKKTMVATTLFNSDESVKLIFTLGSLSNQVYVTATDGNERQMADVLAELEEYDSSGSCLCVGNTFRSPNDYLQEHGRVGSVMLSIDTLPALAILKEEDLIIEGEKIGFLLVAFLTEREYEKKVEYGFDVLLDIFELEGKDIISIETRN